MSKYITLAGVLCILIGCVDRAEVQRENATALSADGELVGTLPDGREVRRYCLEDFALNKHWVYVVGSTVTVNRTLQKGKITEHHVEVTEQAGFDQ